MPTAYVLINCTLGSEENIIKEVAKLPEVKEEQPMVSMTFLLKLNLIAKIQ